MAVANYAGSLKAVTSSKPRRSESPDAEEDTSPIHIESVFSANGELNAAVAKEAARGAELLLSLTPWPAGLPYIVAYRQAFPKTAMAPIVKCRCWNWSTRNMESEFHRPMTEKENAAWRRTAGALAGSPRDIVRHRAGRQRSTLSGGGTRRGNAATFTHRDAKRFEYTRFWRSTFLCLRPRLRTSTKAASQL